MLRLLPRESREIEIVRERIAAAGSGQVNLKGTRQPTLLAQ